MNQANLKKSSLDRIKYWSEMLINWITLVGSIAGAGFGLYQYSENSDADRSKETMKFYELFHNHDYKVARQVIFNTVNNISYDQDLNQYYEKIESSINDNNISSEIEEVIEFYDSLYFCSLEELCNDDLAVLLFGKDSFELYASLSGHIEGIRNGKNHTDKRYALGLEHFFNEYKQIKNKKNAPSLSDWFT